MITLFRKIKYVLYNSHPDSHWYERWYIIAPNYAPAQLFYVFGCEHTAFPEPWYEKWRKLGPAGQRYYDWVNSDAVNDFGNKCSRIETRIARAYHTVTRTLIRAFLSIL